MNRHFLFSARAICLLCTCWQYENGLLQIGGYLGACVHTLSGTGLLFGRTTDMEMRVFLRGGCCIDSFESLKSCLNIEAYSIQLRNASDAAIEIVLEFFQVFTAV